MPAAQATEERLPRDGKASKTQPQNTTIEDSFPALIELDSPIRDSSSGGLMSDTSTSTPAPGVAVRAATAIKNSPARCKSSTNYPHAGNGKVRTVNGPYASVHGRVQCNTSVSKATATSSLYRYRWYGEERILVGKASSRTNTRTSGSSTPHYYCKEQGTYTYIGYTIGKSVEGEKTYSGTSRNTTGDKGMSRFKC